MARSKPIDKQARLRQLKAVLNLQKVGIHWFCKCPFCNDPHRSFCVVDGMEKYVCYNPGCKEAGKITDLLARLGSVENFSPTQMRIE